MFKFCQDVLIDNTFRNLWSLLACSWLDFYVSIRTRCFAIDLYFAFDLLKFWRDVLTSDLYFAICNVFFDQHVFWDVSHQNVRSKIASHEQRTFYNLIRFTIRSYWFSNAFHQSVWSEVASHEWRFLYIFSDLMTRKTIVKFSISSVFVNASVIISEITNFCFTIAHEICDNKRIKSFINMNLKVVVNVYFISDSWYASVQSFIDQTREFAHYQYYYIHRQSRLMHNRKQQKNHSKNCSFRLL